MNRNQQIIRTSLVGIAANLFLAAFKAVAGWAAGSVAIIMDAVNNLSDALSSVITIVGTNLLTATIPLATAAWSISVPSSSRLSSSPRVFSRWWRA